MIPTAYTPIDFTRVQSTVHALVKEIHEKHEELITILLSYESYEVVVDEIDRTIDLLTNLEENETYFTHYIGPVTTFLPRNQPLYALACFVLIPSLQSSEVHFRMPQPLRHVYPKIITLLELPKLFPNVFVSSKERLDFLRERSALLTDITNQYTHPVTDAVIFTGLPKHAEQLRNVFDKRTLFITNGAGHNPIIVSNNAKLDEAAEAATKLVLYNQGQDCAAPNAILVHEAIYDEFLSKVLAIFKNCKVGPYSDPDSRVGPLSSTNAISFVTEILTREQSWIHEETPGTIDIRTQIVLPTVIAKPLQFGGNYTEAFAPIFFLQKYSCDEELRDYFETKEYAAHAMYITLYGTSDYVSSLVGSAVASLNDFVLHPESTFLHNTHLHAPGVERGTQPYGGNGLGASNVAINGRVRGMGTLPQRDIHVEIIAPKLIANALDQHIEFLASLPNKVERNVEKLLKLKPASKSSTVNLAQTHNNAGIAFVDSSALSTDNRYIQVESGYMYTLRNEKNTPVLAALTPSQTREIKQLVLIFNDELSREELKNRLYAIPKLDSVSAQENKDLQRAFFKTIYKLLFTQETGPRLVDFLFETPSDKFLHLLEI